MQPFTNIGNRTPTFDGHLLHLLDTAALVCSEVGHDRATTGQIAAETQVCLAGIYHCITSKADLQCWIALHRIDSLFHGLKSDLEGVVDPRKHFGVTVRDHVCYISRNLNKLRVYVREHETLEYDAKDDVINCRRSYFVIVYDIVKKLQLQQGTLLDSSFETANLLGIISMIIQWFKLELIRVILDDLAAQQTALFLDGYVG
ncbi:MAG: TetR/AcrR family transcriptional regulator [Verrucomicrobia bacterium]|nr:TetR/AcrR family transcriptional regulator [Verrucomicrobiota bacterium]